MRYGTLEVKVHCCDRACDAPPCFVGAAQRPRTVLGFFGHVCEPHRLELWKLLVVLSFVNRVAVLPDVSRTVVLAEVATPVSQYLRTSGT